jgi:uncharacterized protein (DUF427 family)
VYYNVWFLKELKKDAVWLKESQLRTDGLSDYIEFYEQKVKEKKK